MTAGRAHGVGLTIPGYMVWCVLVYAATGSWLTWRIGRPLVGMNSGRYQRESEFRSALFQASLQIRNVCDSRCEQGAHRRLSFVLESVLEMVREIVDASAKLTWITAGYGWISIVAPIIVASPEYFSGKLSFGELMVVVGGFGQVNQSLRWFVDNFALLAEWRATLFRVIKFREVLLTSENGYDEENGTVPAAPLVPLTLEKPPSLRSDAVHPHAMFAAVVDHIRNPALLSSIGFCILFAFIGVFVDANFVLARPPIAVGVTALGLVCFVFLQSMLTTPAGGALARRLGARSAIWGGLTVAVIGLPALIAPGLAAVAPGFMLVGVGTFFAQAVATGFVGQVATINRGAASGMYLASYFGGGLVGSAVLGQVFDRLGWIACVLGIGLALTLAAILAARLKVSAETETVAATPVQETNHAR